MKKTSYEIGKAREHYVAHHLSSLGYTGISVASGKGPDIVAWSGGRCFTIEVKCATDINYGWIVPPVLPARQSDDLIAIILPNRYIEIITMAEHLIGVQKNGVKTITTLIRKRCPEFIKRRGRPKYEKLPHSKKRARDEIIAILKERGDWVA